MLEYKGKPLGIWILSIYIPLFLIYYYIRPLMWGNDGSAYENLIEPTSFAVFAWVSIILDLILAYAVIAGFHKAKNWARVYTIIIMGFGSFWSLYFLIIEQVWPYERFTWLVINVAIIVYLLLEDTRSYFGVKRFLF
jgi:hypothetical protein